MHFVQKPGPGVSPEVFSDEALQGCATLRVSIHMRNNISLSEAFVEDHRHLTQGLSDILQALRDDNLEEAVRMAEDLDQVAGPHMEFEEEILYPEVRKSRGSDYVSRLYREHQVALEAVKALINIIPSTPRFNTPERSVTNSPSAAGWKMSARWRI